MGSDCFSSSAEHMNKIDKRDLQKDLELLDKEYNIFDLTSNYPEQEQQRHTSNHGREWLERAIKAESLNRELVESLELMFEELTNHGYNSPEKLGGVLHYIADLLSKHREESK